MNVLIINPPEVEEELRHPETRLTLDYPEDYEFFKEIFDRLYLPSKGFSLRDIISLLRSNPQLLDINRKVQKAYLEYLKKCTLVKLKDSSNANP